jgi:iron complex outermembrane receptor protein
MNSNPDRVRTLGRHVLTCAMRASIVLLFAATNATAASDDLTELSLEELMGIEVTSVSKKAQAKTSTASAITVITSEDLRRGGFTVIPEALRTVPGVQVARVDANRWAISARGSNNLFANKLLVLVDGRTVYTPTFGGVYWDVQDYPIEDVERIEVIRGPGGTIWGANAVNGVINIITKHAKDTQGGLVSAYGGSHEEGATGRVGVKLGESSHVRAYVRRIKTEDFDVNRGGDGNDQWEQTRGGFRIDSELTDSDSLRVSGDIYTQDNSLRTFNPAFTGANAFFNDTDNEQIGGNVVVNWARKISDTSNFQAKTYYSGYKREFLLEESRHTADVEIQHDFALLDNLAMTWGANYRYSTAHIGPRSIGGTGVTFVPNDDDVHLASGFAQGQLDLFDGMLSFIVGTKVDYNNWSGVEVQPSGRFVVTPTDGHVVWGAVSRAVRTPSQAERDVVLPLPSIPAGGTGVIFGRNDTRSEELLAFELGYRFFPLDWVNAEVALFWNEYDDVQNFVLRAPSPGFPAPSLLAFSNGGELTVRGAEIEVNVLPTDWWRIRMAYSYLNIEQDAESGAVDFGGPKNDNPEHQFNVQSIFDLPYDLEFDVSVYYVDGLPGTVPVAQPDNVEQYVRLDLRLGYKPVEWAEISLVGQNLTDRRHYENTDFTVGQSTQIPRSGYAKVTLTF